MTDSIERNRIDAARYRALRKHLEANHAWTTGRIGFASQQITTLDVGRWGHDVMLPGFLTIDEFADALRAGVGEVVA